MVVVVVDDVAVPSNVVVAGTVVVAASAEGARGRAGTSWGSESGVMGLPRERLASAGVPRGASQTKNPLPFAFC